jgi:3-dehydroquinate dehydratase/shikimate dehydrogenase
VDLEGDVAADLVTDPRTRRLVSWHDLDACPADLAGLIARGATAGAAAVKLAVRVRGFPELLRLLEVARAPALPVIAVGLGPAGIPGRLLYRRLGSAWTYARLAGPSAVAGESAPTLPDLAALRALPGDLAGRGDPVAVFGVLGDRALESIGPRVFNRLFAGRNLSALYLPFQVDKLEGLREFCAAFGVRGVSVTTPFKEHVLRSVDRVEPLARDVGAANTLVLKDGLWVARNTDVAGVYGPLMRALAGSGTRGPALVLGAGGAGRAAAWALRELGFTVTLAARGAARAERAAALLDVRTGEADPGIPWRVVVNATPVGGPRDPEGLPCPPGIVRADQIVFEMNYVPAETPLLRLAAERGARLIPGRTMYAEQAWRQLQIWWGGAPGLEQDLRELVAWATLGLESS